MLNGAQMCSKCEDYFENCIGIWIANSEVCSPSRDMQVSFSALQTVRLFVSARIFLKIQRLFTRQCSSSQPVSHFCQFLCIREVLCTLLIAIDAPLYYYPVALVCSSLLPWSLQNVQFCLFDLVLAMLVMPIAL
jgi:hypothetical protein